MPSISSKGIDMPASPIRRLTPFADLAIENGRKIYHLNRGQPDIETPAGMLEAIKNIDFKVWAYTGSDGNSPYPNHSASYYHNLDYNINPSDLLVTNGGSEAITTAFPPCIGAGDEIIIRAPFY